MRLLFLLPAALLLGCGGGDDDGEGRTCEVQMARQAVLAEDRYILGQAGAYPPDTMLRGRERELYRSQAARREAAWATVSKVLAPIALAQELPNAPATSVPLWQTWYGRDDTTRLFQSLFTELGAEERSSRERFGQPAIDEALGWHATELEALENWPVERRDAYLAAIETSEQLAGVGGLGPVSYSPAALRTFLRSYPELLQCQQAGAPEPFVDTPGDSVQTALREPLSLPSCGSRNWGPFYVGDGETLEAATTGEGASLASLTLWRDGLEVACEPGLACSIEGPGAVSLAVTAGVDGLTEAALQVDYAAPNAPWASCLEQAFASDSAVVKASWARAQFEQTLPVYDTSGEALRTTLSANAVSGWGEPVRQADPGPESIYTIERPSGGRYRLAGLHIMTKELEHWQWTTLWWSDTPDRDFGEDRPESIRSLGGPWSNYKMCTVTMFDEGDADPTGGFAETAPTLADALEAVHGGAGAPTWCSNPYIELGEGNMGTNCIGCHQHGGTELLSETIIRDDETYPDFGRTQLRNNFPHDYSWAPEAGDELTLAFKAIVDFLD